MASISRLCISLPGSFSSSFGSITGNSFCAVTLYKVIHIQYGIVRDICDNSILEDAGLL